MNNSKIFEGKTTNEAIEAGLKYFKVSKDMVNIKVLEEEKRSFFSILTPRVVKVEMSIKEAKETRKPEKKNIVKKEKTSDEDKEKSEKIVREFINEFLKKVSAQDVAYNINIVDEYIEVSFEGKNISYLIGYRGEVLNDFQTLLNAVLRNKLRTGLKVIVDVCGYKKERQKTLEELAERVAGNVIKTKKSVTLEPMRPYERKIIHSKLQQNSKIKTYSIGEEPHRRIVVSLEKNN